MSKINNNWTVLSNEEMVNIKGGMEGLDPITFAAENPDDFMKMWVEDPKMMFHWFDEAGYSRQDTMRYMSRFFRSYYRNRKHGGC